MLARGRRVWSPTFSCSRVRAISLVRDRGDHQVSLRARTGDSALHRGPLPVASDDQEVSDEADQGQGGRSRRPPRQCGRLHEGDDARRRSRGRQAAVPHHPSGAGRAHGVLDGRRGEDRGHGGDGDLLAGGLLRPRGALRGVVALQRRPRQERPGAQDGPLRRRVAGRRRRARDGAALLRAAHRRSESSAN
jgi:hypothetical protein